ncbi:MAG: LacI family DNA-binding transcriptional regulator [Naasia sp.]
MGDDPADGSRSRPRTVGVREVAQAAGVSTQTVSRVLNGHAYIRDETRQRVLDAMTELDYRVNNAARALGTQKTKTIGIIASDASLYGPSAGLAALEASARDADRWVVTAFADGGDESSVLEAVDHVRGQGVDGIILVAPHERTRDVVERRVGGEPVAVLHGGAGSGAQRRGAEAVVEHLLALGHTRIARVGGPADWLEELARAEGFDRALSSAGLGPTASWAGDWSAGSAFGLADEVGDLISSSAGPTAVVVANDQMALGLIAGLRRRGVRVPADVSVVGFDDNPDAAFYTPALTTVRLDIAGEARRCIAEVLGGAGRPGGDPQSDPVSAPRLVVRESSAAPAR